MTEAVLFCTGTKKPNFARMAPDCLLVINPESLFGRISSGIVHHPVQLRGIVEVLLETDVVVFGPDLRRFNLIPLRERTADHPLKASFTGAWLHVGENRQRITRCAALHILSLS
jgi:hypothetical protein